MTDSEYLDTVPDSVVMTPQVLIALMKKYKHYRNTSFGFSAKHTNDIQEYRKKQGLEKNESSIPGNLYNLPVTWNCEVTYIK